MSRHRAPRGASLIEVMVSSAVLLAAMVGIMQLLIHGATFQRRGIQSVNSVLYAQQSLEEFSSAGFAGLTAGTWDGGEVFDAVGRRFGRIITVADLSVDAGWPAFEVTVRVESGAPNEPMLVTTARTVVPQEWDGGL